mmetsp:Transcript_29199/g.67209  ORF Transcript_29199/g.67209 Transcript_29199/m.67209 type:complete len:493 (-) Transcript_29199:84-1562(-)
MATTHSPEDAIGSGGPLSQRTSQHLLRYLGLVTICAFYARALPGPFLPIVLMENFGQTASMVGISIAAYPLAALVATPLATHWVANSDNIFRTHSAAVMAMAATNASIACAAVVLDLGGPTMATAAIVFCRILQGIGFALYIAAHTVLVTRVYPNDVAYILALVEVFVGIGGQLGRLLGGVVYDHAGFEAPFLSIAIIQAVLACIGASVFAGQPIQSICGTRVEKQQAPTGAEEGVEPQPPRTAVRWCSLLLPRVLVGMLAVLLTFFQVGFYDATLSPHLKQHLNLVTATPISILMVLRSTSYLLSSLLCAELLKNRKVSLELLIVIGASLCSVAWILIPPLQSIADLLEWALARSGRNGDEVLKYVSYLALQVVALLIASAGSALLFVPSLPLMQKGVRHLGQAAVEQTTALFMAMMSIGETLGPSVGGWLTHTCGFQIASMLAVLPYASEAALATVNWDPHAAHSPLSSPASRPVRDEETDDNGTAYGSC